MTVRARYRTPVQIMTMTREWRTEKYSFTIWDRSVFVKIEGDVSFRYGESIPAVDVLAGRYDQPLKKAFSRHVPREVKGALAEGREQKWHQGGDRVEVTPVQLTVAEADRYGGTGATFSVKEFLEGANRAFVVEHFGAEVWEEAAAIVAELTRSDR